MTDYTATLKSMGRNARGGNDERRGKQMASTSPQQDWLTRLDASHQRTLACVRAGNADDAALSSLADLEAFSALNLEPMPADPIMHLRVGYAKTRPYLEHLTRHDPARIVRISGRDGYVYPMTPRKILRRVLDHALDHLNQVDQWTDWQDHGLVPTPTDGWAPSAVTFDDDAFPLTDAELSAWLWRIDRAIALLIHRAAGLTQAQLDWQPPDGGWSLHRVLHHVARWYGYAAWLDEALPEDAEARYSEAQQRLRNRIARLVTDPPSPDTAFYENAGREFTLAEAVDDVLAAEAEIQTTGRLAPGPSETGTQTEVVRQFEDAIAVTAGPTGQSES
jgi:DinB superfamily